MTNAMGEQADGNDSPVGGATGSIQGQVLRRSAHREVAIYLRAGELWIADFVDGDGRLMPVATWLRFNCATRASAQAQARMVRECAIPLSQDLVSKIEELHRQAADDIQRSTTGASS
jgi:hypothetical protein